MAKLPYEDILELLKTESAPSVVPKKTSPRVDYDSNELEDIGYEPPTQEQINAPGFQAASKYLKNSTPITGDRAAKLLADYKALNSPNRDIASEEDLGDAPTVDPRAFDLGNAPTVDPRAFQLPGSLKIDPAVVNASKAQEPQAPEMMTERSPATMPQMESTIPEAEQLSLDNMPSEQLAKKQSLLEQYKELIAQKQNRNSKLDMLQGSNQIAQAIASGYGGKIGDGSDVINQMRKTAEAPANDLLGQSKAVDTQNELEMSDPNSDISKFARERAVAIATKMGMSPDKIKQLDNMSAKQLEKLGLYKPETSSGGDLYFTTISDEKGNPKVVAVSKTTGQIVQEVGTKGFASQVIKDADGNIVEFKRGTDQASNMTGQATAPAGTETGKVTAKGADISYDSPTALKKMSPKLYEKFNKIQEDFVKDMKESREVATGATTLAAKLTPGPNGVDSGLLGGIQTQAAKMAGQKGVLTDQDLVKFAGAGGVQASIDRIIDGSMFGEMSDQDIKFFNAFAKKMRGVLDQDINDRSQIFAKQIHNEAKDYLPGLSENNVAKWLQVQSVAPSVQKQNPATSNPEENIVIREINGKRYKFDKNTKQNLGEAT